MTSKHLQQPTPTFQINQQQEEQHHDSCTCILCRKEEQVQNMRKIKMKRHLHSIYQNHFMSNNNNRREGKGKSKGHSKNHISSNNQEDEFYVQNSHNRNKSSMKLQEYLDLQSTYGADFVTKRTDISKSRPTDNLGGNPNYMPGYTTYMRSYQSTMTPKPDEPFKRIEMPAGANNIKFSSQSVYQKAFKVQHNTKPNLPFIHPEAISKPKSLGLFESTQKMSYATIANPQGHSKNSKLEINLKPSQNIINLAPFTHGYDTTYRNYYASSLNKQKTRNQEHALDQLGNINRRKPNTYMF